jgi:hypothetical protein
MKNLGSDIFVFEKIIPEYFIDTLTELRINSKHCNRIDLVGKNLHLLYEFDRIWMESIEPDLLGEYLKIYDVEQKIGYNVSRNTIESIRKYCQTKWRDLFILHYNQENSKDTDKRVHWDFSGLTAVGALNADYEGGELCFPRHNIEYKLDKGDIIIFPGGLTHPHYVNSVRKGRRNVIVGQSLTLVQDHKIDY